ncbi:MAG: SIR2 family protein [Opitutaceae bacterium]|nr:SIR2 family protein [Opitutaceae bacterium]
MIDPMISLAFAVYSNKGAYALLLGSGISRASGIPTGWEVILDLVRKVAKLEGENCEPDPADWFRNKHKAEPDYSKLLDEIAKSPTERQQLLRGYFEPTDDERSQGLKLPNAAHKAIAQLVVAGYLRVVITTNFDRLMEMALEEVGVAPTVISTTDQLSGALPLPHSGVTVIKLHGDYLDTRIKNTELELATYDKALDVMLDRIFDEYGLIVSGWSGAWDLALRAAFERCPNRRFTTFWTTRSPLSEVCKKLAEHRQAAVLQIKDANQLFEELRAKVQALRDMAAPHPLSAKMAAATVKRHLVDPSAKIRLRDLVHEETEKLFAEINAQAFAAQAQHQPAAELIKRVEKYEACCETLISIFVTGCYWGDPDACKLWVSSLQRIANPTDSGGGLVYLLKLRRYPALLLLYSAGLAAVAAGNYATLAAVLTKSKARDDQNKNEAICSVVYPIAVNEQDVWKMMPGLERRHTPVSDHLFKKSREPLREFLPRDEDYQDVFDRFEYLLGLAHADLNRWGAENGWWGPVGCFAWRGRRFDQGDRTAQKIGAEIVAEGVNWPLLKAGLFGGSLEQLNTAKAKFDAFLGCVHYF